MKKITLQLNPSKKLQIEPSKKQQRVLKSKQPDKELKLNEGWKDE